MQFKNSIVRLKKGLLKNKLTFKLKKDANISNVRKNIKINYKYFIFVTIYI